MRKRLVLSFLSVLLLLFTNLNAQVYNGDLTLTSQAQVDAFNYTSVTGDLTIQESVSGNIVNLNGLSELTSVGADLNILSNEALNNLTGLSNLGSIGGDLFIAGTALSDIEGLNNLTTIGGILYLKVNPALTNISGLNGLISIGGQFRVVDSDLLAKIDGLNGLITLGGELKIESYNALTSIDGLNSLTAIVGDLEIFGSSLTHIGGFTSLSSIEGDLFISGTALSDIDGFNNLTTIGGILYLKINPALINISGLNGLTSIGGQLRIVGSDALAKIDGFNGLKTIGGGLNIESYDALTSINGFNSLTTLTGLEIHGNLLTHIGGFSSLSSIEGQLFISGTALTDIDGLSNLTTIGGDLYLKINPALVNISGLNGLTSIGGQLRIIGSDALAKIDGLNGLKTIEGDLQIDSYTSLTSIEGLKSLNSIGGNFEIHGNSLTNIDGLFNLTSVAGDLFFSGTAVSNLHGLKSLASVGGYLYFKINNSLTNLDGLENLTSVGEYLAISSNNSLTNLDGLLNLTSVGGDLYIQDNTNLSRFCGLYKLLQGNGLAGSYNVSGNAVNPTEQEIIVAGSQAPVLSDVSVSAVMLAPPNHKMKDITVNYTATSACGPPRIALTVSSNEPINGTGDGDTSPDWIIVDDHHVKLRAERAANGNGRIYTITITATNLVGVTSIKTVEVRVAHNITDPHSGKAFIVNSTVNFSGEFWDKPTNKHTAKWLIDDNTTVKGIVTEPTANKNGKVTGSYKFTSPGVYKLQMNTTDQNNLTSYANTNGDLEAIVVIYDPNGGSTYGGGYFNSPAGALRSNPSATGKASYGFAMNYFKNSTNPKGETQFEFKVGEFEFNALNFDYLVISNSMAQFKGTGKIIGGQSGVGFIMTVVDGQLDGTGVDKIRMKIYNKNNGSVIYDNQPVASDAALPTQAVGTNSVVVISGNNNSNITKSSANQKAEMEEKAPEVSNDLDVIAFPNPSTNNFSITVKGNSIEKILMQVIDAYGRLIEARNVSANSMIRFGDRYNSGTYFIRVLQGKQHKEIKLIKL